MASDNINLRFIFPPISLCLGKDSLPPMMASVPMPAERHRKGAGARRHPTRQIIRRFGQGEPSTDLCDEIMTATIPAGARKMSDIPDGREFWRGLKLQIARRIKNPSDAEDLLHSAFVKFHEYRLEKEVTNPAAFLVRTACNLGIDSFRQRKNTAEASEAELIGDKTPLQDEVVAYRERLRRVQAGIDRLPPKTREIFLMHRWHEMKYQEIADRLEISVSSIEKHMASALMFLAEWSEGW